MFAGFAPTMKAPETATAADRFRAAHTLDRPSVKPSARSAVSTQPMRHGGAGRAVAQAQAEANGAAALVRTSTDKFPGGVKPASGEAVPHLMRQALEKYERLMQTRQTLSVADEI